MADQNNRDLESIANKPPVPPRDDLVNKAATFLSSPNVQKSREDMKIAFLRKKGLSDAEIELAQKKSESMLQIRAVDIPPYPVYQPPVHWSSHPRWITFRDVVNTLMLLAGFAYGIYWIYKECLSL